MYTSIGSQVTQATKFYKTAPNIFSTIIELLSLTHKNVYHFIRTEQKVPDKGYIHGSLQNCGVDSVELASYHDSGPPECGGSSYIFGKRLCIDMVHYHP